MLRIKGDTPPPPPIEDESIAEESIDELPVEEAPVEEMPTSLPAIMGGLVDPSVARYFGPDAMCGGCIHFTAAEGGGACEIVAGPIDPEGICSLYTADEVADEAPTDEPTDIPEDIEEPEA